MNTASKIMSGFIARTSIVLILLVAWWLFQTPSVQAAGPVCTVGASGATYTTIQAAVNDTGCATINVAAGTYTENLKIGRNVAINGATNGSTIVDGNNAGSVVVIQHPEYRLLSVQLTRLTFQHGNASQLQTAGGVSVFNANVDVVNSTVRDNYAENGGGGLHIVDGTLTIANSTITKNRGRFTSGLFVRTGSATLLNSTMAWNSGGGGGAIQNEWGTMTLKNSIVANNDSVVNCYRTVIDGGHNLISDSSCGGIPATDPKLDPNGIQNNGGPTGTIALLAGSPAIDAGDDTLCKAAPVNALDQRGSTRPKGARCDIGAVEMFLLSAPNAAGRVVAWGENAFGRTTVPAGLNAVAVAGGFHHSLALKADGTVVGWGWNQYNQLNVPAGLNDAVAIAAGDAHSLALRSNGTVLAWGYPSYGINTVPAGLSEVVAIAAGSYHNVALKADGTVVVWGRLLPVCSTNGPDCSAACGAQFSVSC